MAVNCYTTRVFREGGQPLIVESADGDMLDCVEYDGDRYSIRSQFNFDDLLASRFEFVHYHGLCTTTYDGWLDLARGRLFRIPYISAWIYTTHGRLSQAIFNRRKLVTKQRIDLLRVILSAQLNGTDNLSSLSVMSHIHTDKWVLHPHWQDEHHRLQFYLDALAETKELVKNGVGYQITGQGIAAIELYEEQERMHSENISTQRGMFLLTIVIALLTIVQAGLVKLPLFLDLSK